MELFVILVAAGVAAGGGAVLVARRLRSAQPSTPPPEQEAILSRSSRLYRRLPESLRPAVRRRTQEILRTKNFEGCGGLELTDEIRVAIAGLAALLVAARPGKAYPSLRSILVYPRPFITRHEVEGPAGLIEETDEVMYGESWGTGAVILAWSEVRRAGREDDSGYNLALHEFAHQLDEENRGADGAPLLDGDLSAAEWSRVFGREYERLRSELAQAEGGVLDPYGATDPAEFFAVATEAFFERPQALRARHADLYQQLQGFYGLDPASF